MRMKFSERMGINEVKKIIQIESMDNGLRTALWNVIVEVFIERWTFMLKTGKSEVSYTNFIKKLYIDHFNYAIDSIDTSSYEEMRKIKTRYYAMKWDEVYDFIEFMVNEFKIGDKSLNPIYFNNALKKEVSGYRFINNELVLITDENQISEIQKAIDSTLNNKYNGANIHLQASLKLLSKKIEPDYRNSIKESISAVESIAFLICPKKSKLIDALKELQNKLGLHEGLVQGYLKLYGYTSDGDGIRHSLQDETNLDIEDAIYFLVSCSAFVNYLIAKAEKAQIDLNID